MADATTDDLDGHTIEQLAEYVDRGRTPVDPAIEASASCRSAIAALERLREATTLLADEGTGFPPDRTWLDGVLARISLDARAGADFPLLVTDDGDHVVMTEGALRALIRAAGDDQPGFLVGRVRFAGDLADPDAELGIALDVVVGYGVAVPDGVARLRAAIGERLRAHTLFRRIRVDVTVRDLLVPGGDR